MFTLRDCKNSYLLKKLQESLDESNDAIKSWVMMMAPADERCAFHKDRQAACFCCGLWAPGPRPTNC
jgi:hypothetical protein